MAYRYHPTLLGLAQSCDVLMVVASGGAETRHIVNKDVLEALGPDGIVINVGRGTVIDEQALVAALRDKKILSAGLDVFEDEPRVPAELIAMDHVVLLPHVGLGLGAHAQCDGPAGGGQPGVLVRRQGRGDAGARVPGAGGEQGPKG